jgi:hypothetical protein
MFKGKVLLFSLLLVFATSVFAGDVDECQSDAGVSICCMQISCCPAGDFQNIWEEGGYIWVDVKDALGTGIPGVPWTDFWLDACEPLPEYALCLCPSAVVADSLTNVNGRTTISGRLALGGCVLTGGIYVSVQGKILEIYPDCLDYICLDLILKSPDRNHDCYVGVSDLVYLASSYNKASGDPAYDQCVDWNHDGIVNISDFAFLGAHYTHECF